ncbi:hypothetical protein ACN47A_08010 [Myxococcus fulvus]|uniref:hypothetical protein n=1 Tax=Myxococcus fulvus TaxID=33 RepID=UPI003B9D332C
MSVPTKYTPSQTAAMREQVLKEHIEPQVRDLFARFPALRSATFLVAQYWDDEARDAVHRELTYSELETPDLAAASRAEDDDPINHPTTTWRAVFDAQWKMNRPAWHDNGDAIPLFAAFTREGCHQDMDPLEAYAPYAIFRRTGDGVSVEHVGVMLRPWLDGVRPEWEQPDDDA